MNGNIEVPFLMYVCRFYPSTQPGGGALAPSDSFMAPPQITTIATTATTTQPSIGLHPVDATGSGGGMDWD